MKYKNILIGATILGIITFLLPVVTGNDISLAPASKEVARYLRVPSPIILFVLWYGAFSITLLLSLLNIKSIVFSRIRYVIIILLNIYAIAVHLAITSELLGRTGALGFGGIIYYLSAVANIFVCILLFKEGGINIKKEDLMNIAQKGVTVGKTAANVATTVAKTAVSEVKKEIDSHKSNSDESQQSEEN